MEPGAAGRPELLPQLRLDELLAELEARLQSGTLQADGRGLLCQREHASSPGH